MLRILYSVPCATCRDTHVYVESHAISQQTPPFYRGDNRNLKRLRDSVAVKPQRGVGQDQSPDSISSSVLWIVSVFPYPLPLLYFWKIYNYCRSYALGWPEGQAGNRDVWMEDNKVRRSGLMRAFLNQRHSGVQMGTYLKGQTEESVGPLSLGSQVGGGPRFFFFFKTFSYGLNQPCSHLCSTYHLA